MIADALTLLDNVAPHYAEWIRHALNFIILLLQIENRSCSGSWADASGMIYMTEPVSALEAAEILVHESSHQYFHMLERTSEVCKPGPREMFYSPLVKKHRPLDRILIAYHAFANVLIMYMAAVEQGHGDQHTVNRFHAFCEDVAPLEVYEDRSAGLSDLGLTLFLPLRVALAAARADFVQGTQGVERSSLFRRSGATGRLRAGLGRRRFPGRPCRPAGCGTTGKYGRAAGSVVLANRRRTRRWLAHAVEHEARGLAGVAGMQAGAIVDGSDGHIVLLDRQRHVDPRGMSVVLNVGQYFLDAAENQPAALALQHVSSSQCRLRTFRLQAIPMRF